MPIPPFPMLQPTQTQPQTQKIPSTSKAKGKSAFDFTVDDDVNPDRDLVPSSQQYNPDKNDGNESDDISDNGEQLILPSQNKEAMKYLLDRMTPEQLQRYEIYRRAHLPRAAIKKVIQKLLSQNVPPSATIVFAGCGKMFVGEIVELAKEIMQERGDIGAIKPEHLREAHSRYKKLHTSNRKKAPIFK